MHRVSYYTYRDYILDKSRERTYSTLINVNEISTVSSVKVHAERSILSCDGCTILEALTPHIHRLSTTFSVRRSSHDTLCTFMQNVIFQQQKNIGTQRTLRHGNSV